MAISAPVEQTNLSLLLLKEWDVELFTINFTVLEKKSWVLGIRGNINEDGRFDKLPGDLNFSLEALEHGAFSPKLLINDPEKHPTWVNWRVSDHQGKQRSFDLFSYPLRRDLVTVDELLVEYRQSILAEQRNRFGSEYQILLKIARMIAGYNYTRSEVYDFLADIFSDLSATTRVALYYESKALSNLKIEFIEKLDFRKKIRPQIRTLWEQQAAQEQTQQKRMARRPGSSKQNAT